MIDLSQKNALFAHTTQQFCVLVSKNIVPLHRQTTNISLK